MENKARYTIVGFFIITFTILLIGFILWLTRYDIDKLQAKEYRIYMNDSVAGLNVKSIVEYKGLDIGTVSSIKINPRNFEQIEIILKIKKPEIIKTDTYAIINSQGITGNKIISLDGGTNDAPILKSKDDYAIIPMKQSLIDNLTSQAEIITHNIDIMLLKLNQILNEKNINNIDKILDNTEVSSDKLNSVLDNANNTSKKFDELILKTNTLIESNLNKSVESINTLSTNINNLINTDVKLILDNLKDTTNSSKNIDKVMSDFQNTLENIDNSLDTLNNQGGDMLFNTREIKYGPGELK